MSKNLSHYVPILKFQRPTSTTWTTTGNTHTISDEAIDVGSQLIIFHTAAPIGRWYVTTATAAGSITITSSDVENAGLAFDYLVL